jgi:uncharacterized membrane protein
MTKLDLTQLTNEELQIELKKRKNNYQAGAFLVGMMIGVAIWGVVKYGKYFLLVMPFIFGYWFRNSKTEFDEIKKEMQSRNS